MRFNNRVSNRVLVATFDDNWERSSSSDEQVIYTAKANKSEVTLKNKDGKRQTLVFDFGSKIIVVGKTFHFPPHKLKPLP